MTMSDKNESRVRRATPDARAHRASKRVCA